MRRQPVTPKYRLVLAIRPMPIYYPKHVEELIKANAPKPKPLVGDVDERWGLNKLAPHRADLIKTLFSRLYAIARKEEEERCKSSEETE